MSVSIGGYASLIESCVEAGDFSPLAPMSVKDSIWIRVGLALRARRDAEFDAERAKPRFKVLETLYLAVCDLREIALDTNYYNRFEALKSTKVRKINPFDTRLLPSVAVEEERKETARRAKMTPEELAAEEYRDFMAGKKVRRSVG